MIRQATDDYGAPIGQAHGNSILETCEFEVELENGETDRIIANQIAANIHSQLNDEGREIIQLKFTIGH